MTIKEHLEEALDQVSKALIGALQDKNEDQVVKLFELYNKVKEALPKDTSGFSIDFSDYNVAAGPVDVPYGGLGQDVISFGDTIITGGDDTISLG